MSDAKARTPQLASAQALPLKVAQASRPAPSQHSATKRPQVTPGQRDDQSMRSGRSGRSANSARSGHSAHSRPSSVNPASRNASPNARFRCDDCVNKHLVNNHRQQQQDARKADRDFYQRVHSHDTDLIEQARQREARKLQEFQEARDRLLHQRSVDKQAQRERDRSEKKQLHDQFADRRDLIERERVIQERKDQHKRELEEQREAAINLKKVKREEDRTLAQQTHNLLIDDGWRQQHYDELRKHYHQNLVNQVHDVRQGRAEERTQQLEAGRADLASVIRRQNEATRAEQAAKEAQKRLFNTENAKAVEGKRNNDRMEIEEAEATKEMLRETARHHEQVAQANRQKREELGQATAAANLERKGERRIQALAEKLEDRKYLGGLHVPQREAETRECDSCRQTKDLRRQNRVFG